MAVVARQEGEPATYSKIGQEIPPLTNSGGALIAVIAVVAFLSTVWVVLRVWARRIRKVGLFYSEDILCYLALISYYAVAANTICMIILGGIGYHITQLQGFQIERFSKTVFIGQVTYALTLGFAKLSIARNFQRIFGTSRSFRIASSAVMALTVMWVLQTILIGVLICRPIQLNWDPTIRDGHCGDETAAFTSVSAVDMFVDVLLLVLPIRPLMALQMKTAHKIALAAIFSGGFITLIVTAIRLYLTYTIDFMDLSQSVVKSMFLNVIQPGLAIIVACSPLLKPILDRLLLATGMATANKSKGSYGNSGNSGGSGKLRTIGQASSNRRDRWGLVSKSGFERMTYDKDELHSQIELGVVGRNEAIVSAAKGADHESDEGITIVRDTTVAREVV